MKDRIKALRVGRGMNQSELGKLLGVGQKTISGMERGENNPTVAQLKILSDYFGVSIDYIVKGVEISVTNYDRELLNAVKEDASLYQSLTTILNAKKNIMNRLQAA